MYDFENATFNALKRYSLTSINKILNFEFLNFIQIRSNATYNKISYDNSWDEKRNRGPRTGRPHTIPEGLDPLSTQHSKHHHEGVPKVIEVPTRNTILSKFVRRVGFSKHFHPHQSKDVDHKTQDEGDVPDRPNAVSDCC